MARASKTTLKVPPYFPPRFPPTPRLECPKTSQFHVNSANQSATAKDTRSVGLGLRSTSTDRRQTDQTQHGQYHTGRFWNVDQVDRAQIATPLERPNHREIARHELLGQSSLSHVAEREGAKAAAKGGLEDVVVGVIIEAAAEILRRIAGEDSGRRVDIDRR